MRRDDRIRHAIVGVSFALLVVGGVAFAVMRTQALPEGPQPVAWDKEPCAHCHMHVSEPPFASHLILTDGRVLHFDDPGCLFRYVVANEPAVHQSWFRDHTQARWLSGESARFVTVPMSPMGYLQGATTGPADLGQSFDEAVAAVRALPEAER